MILYPTQLFAMVREGRMTLQIPEIVLGTPPSEQGEEVRFEHVTRLNKYKPSPRGFLFYSRLGFEHYRERLQAEFRDTGRGTWEDFVIEAERSFEDIIRELDREIARHQRAIAKLQALRDGR